MKPLEILPTGAWTDSDERNHKFDAGLAGALVEFFDMQERPRIIDLGCGPGRYVFELSRHGHAALGYDGNPQSPFVQDRTCAVADLTSDLFYFSADWMLFLEVGEHIPAKHEPAIWNHLGHARQGVILSWATPGQSGHGHVNCREPEYIGQKMADLGFVEGDAARLRVASALEWFRRNLRIFTRC